VSDLTRGGGTGPAAIAISPILSVRYRPRDLERIAAAAPGARIALQHALKQAARDPDHR